MIASFGFTSTTCHPTETCYKSTYDQTDTTTYSSYDDKWMWKYVWDVDLSVRICTPRQSNRWTKNINFKKSKLKFVNSRFGRFSFHPKRLVSKSGFRTHKLKQRMGKEVLRHAK